MDTTFAFSTGVNSFVRMIDYGEAYTITYTDSMLIAIGCIQLTIEEFFIALDNHKNNSTCKTCEKIDFDAIYRHMDKILIDIR